MSVYEQVKVSEKNLKKTDSPYFKRNIISKASPSTKNVIQGYFPVPGTDYIQSAPPVNAQLTPAPPRYIAVHKYEPATIYFSTSIPGNLRRPVGEFLNRLGMLPSVTSSTVQINGTLYQRFRQVAKRYSPERALQSYGMEDEKHKPIGLNSFPLAGLAQPNRTSDEEVRAKSILDIQSKFMVDLENILRRASAQDQDDFGQLEQNLKTLINVYYGTSGNYTKGAMISLGSDILYTAFALLRYIQMKAGNDGTSFPREIPVVVPGCSAPRGIVDIDLSLLQTREENYTPSATWSASEPVYNINTDEQLLLELIKEEIKIRKSQLEAEIAHIKFKPVIRTGCNTSALDLSEVLQKDKGLVFSTGFDHSRLRFIRDIGWNWHAACKVPLPVGQLTSDKLVLEDAVGKSSDTNEKANAHWFARLYGNDETAGAAQIPLPTDVLLPENQENFQLWTPIPSCCKFNQTDLSFRRAFFEVRGHAPGDAWLLLNDDGRMKAHITPNYQIEYNFKKEKETLSIPVIDFIRTTADAVMDDLMIQELAVQAYLRKTESNPQIRTEDIGNIRTTYLTHPKAFVDVIEEWYD